jgi:uncharacterized membrane protein (UPF0127 family)
VVRIGALLVTLAACTKAAAPPEPAPVAPPVQPVAQQQPDLRPRVIVTGPRGDIAVAVEVVDTDPLIEKGLMYRQHLPPDEGMLFVMGAEDDWRFWMRNTLIPLDILFIKRDMTVAGVLENMRPLDEHSKGVGTPSLYVLEVNAGWSKAHGVGAGARVAFERVTSTGPEGGFGNR